MIQLDPRTGSGDLIHSLPAGQAALVHLGFGDACFIGAGPEGPVLIGIEIKKLGDLLRSIVTGRLEGHQLPGLLRDYHVIYLLLEGKHRADPHTGLLQVPKPGRGWQDAEFGAKRWMHRDVAGFLTSLENLYGVRTRYSYDRRDTARVLAELHHWWTDKEWDEHHSGRAFDVSGEPTLLPASAMRRVAAQLKGIGWKRSQAVEAHFSSIIDMINAPLEEWQRVEGLGPKTAAQVVDEIWRTKR